MCDLDTMTPLCRCTLPVVEGLPLSSLNRRDKTLWGRLHAVGSW